MNLEERLNTMSTENRRVLSKQIRTESELISEHYPKEIWKDSGNEILYGQFSQAISVAMGILDTVSNVLDPDDGKNAAAKIEEYCKNMDELGLDAQNQAHIIRRDYLGSDIDLME